MLEMRIRFPVSSAFCLYRQFLIKYLAALAVRVLLKCSLLHHVLHIAVHTLPLHEHIMVLHAALADLVGPGVLNRLAMLLCWRELSQLFSHSYTG